jgi:glycosyltransferase involved in cell wall biosynthesis
MRILIIVHSVSWIGGGAFFHALHIATGLSKLGNKVSILSTSKDKRLKFVTSEIKGISLIESPDLLIGQARNGWDIYNTIRRIWFLRKTHFDIVHLLDTRPNVIFPGLFLKFTKKSKLIIEWLDWFGKGGTATERRRFIRFFMLPIETFFEEKFRPYADGSIGLGIPLTKRLIGLGVRSNVITMYHGCDTFQALKDNKVITTTNKETKIVGYVGRMREDVMIRLVELSYYLIEKYDSDFVISIIGNSTFPVMDYLNEEIRNHFNITGWLSYEEVQNEMMKCNVLILPFDNRSIARNNIWPSKINDYLSMGKPIVTTKLTVFKDIFQKNEIGLMCDDTTEAIGSSVFRIFNDEALERYFSENSIELANGALSWDSIIIELVAFYKKVIDN